MGRMGEVLTASKSVISSEGSLPLKNIRCRVIEILKSLLSQARYLSVSLV